MKLRHVHLIPLVVLALALPLMAQDSLNVRILSDINLWQGPYSIALDGNYAFVAVDRDSGLKVIDVSDPVHPVVVGECGVPVHANGVTLSGGYAYVIEHTSALHIIDIHDPAHPTAVGVCTFEGWATDVAVSGDYAIVTDGGFGFRIFDISHPAAPVEICQYDTPGYAAGVAIDGHYAYIADGNSSLRIYDISNPEDPISVGRYQTPGYAWNVAVRLPYAYMTDSNGSLRIIDVSAPETPVETGTLTIPGNPTNMTLVGEYVYLVDFKYGMRIVDISNPVAPVQVGYHSMALEVRAIAAGNGLAYAAGFYHFQIFDCSSALGSPDPVLLPPSSFSLSSYPNPFNPSTQISFTIPQTAPVELRVYDLQGRLVETLASQVYEAGQHTLRFDGSNLASGVYMLQMTSGSYSRTQKLMLLK